MSEIGERAWQNGETKPVDWGSGLPDDTGKGNRVRSTSHDSVDEGDPANSKSVGSVNSLLTTWLQGFNRKTAEFRTQSSDNSEMKSHSDPKASTQSDPANREALTPPSLHDHSINARPVLSRNLARNSQQYDAFDTQHSGSRGNWNVRIISETLRPDSMSLPLSPRSPFANDAGQLIDEVSELREFLSVSRTYDECLQFFQNLDIPSTRTPNFPALCLQLELDEAKTNLQELTTQLEQEKFNTKTIYDNFHIAVWVCLHSPYSDRLICLTFVLKGLGGFPDGEIGIELEDMECSDGLKAAAESAGGTDGVKISRVADWGPAQASMMRVGDIIEKVSGYDVKGLSANFVQHLIKGPSGDRPCAS
jgi:hypothetical protein